jgi:formate hydrogenlyase subunit 3/multisubunit Na+/H+ antiporter MnhD subunit
LAVTLAVGVFALAGLPPFVGFMGKLSLLTAAWQKGHSTLVILAMINAAIAVYYYLSVVREAWFRDPGDLAPIRLDWSSRALCWLLIAGILTLGIAPARLLDTLSNSVNRAGLTFVNTPGLAVNGSTRAAGTADDSQALDKPPRQDRTNGPGRIAAAETWSNFQE